MKKQIVAIVYRNADAPLEGVFSDEIVDLSLEDKLHFAIQLSYTGVVATESEWEYMTREGGRKSEPPGPPEGDGWIVDTDRGRVGTKDAGWDRFDFHEEYYYKRLVPKAVVNEEKKEPISQVVFSFSATFGLFEGYADTQKSLVITTNAVNHARDKFRDNVRLVMEEIRVIYGTVVSVVMQPSTVIYPENLGCPHEGEYATTISSCMNPAYDKDGQSWRQAVQAFIERLKVVSKQTTVRIEWSAVSVTYLSSKA